MPRFPMPASQVVEVIEDSKRGLVAVLDGKGEADTVAKALGGFTRPYDLAPPDSKAPAARHGERVAPE